MLLKGFRTNGNNMNPQQLEKKTHRIIDAYIQELDNYTLEQLITKPSETSWSIGQVYIHLWMSAKGFFFKNADFCLKAEGTEKGKSKNWQAFLIFLFEKMPTVKIKMPSKVAVEPRQPESKEQLIQKLNDIKQLTTEYVAKIPQSDADLKTKHPFLSYLNCGEWIALCNIHFKHHKAQIKRIKSQLHF